jgi:hypothetical protein
MRHEVVERVVDHLRQLEEDIPEWDRVASLNKLYRINFGEGWGWDESIPGRPNDWLRVEGVRLDREEIAEVHRQLPVDRWDVLELLSEANVEHEKIDDIVVVDDGDCRWATWRSDWNAAIDEVVDLVNGGHADVDEDETLADAVYDHVVRRAVPWVGLSGACDGDGEGSDSELISLVKAVSLARTGRGV